MREALSERLVIPGTFSLVTGLKSKKNTDLTNIGTIFKDSSINFGIFLCSELSTLVCSTKKKKFSLPTQYFLPRFYYLLHMRMGVG